MTEATTTKVEETFEQKLARTEGVDQDLASTLAENWQRVVGSFLAVLLAVWVYGEYKAANESKVGEASKRFAIVQETLEKIAKDKDEASIKLITDNLTALKTTYDGTSYSEFAPLYEASSLLAQGKLDQAEDKFRKLTQVQTKEELGKNDLIKELAGLALARTLLDEQKESEAMKTLESLIKNSRIVNVEALLILARVSEDKAPVEGLAKELKISRPEFAELIDREIVKFGINL